MPPFRIELSSPHMSGGELPIVLEAFADNWVGPLGPHVRAFEEEFAAAIGAPHAVALASGTAAIHLALIAAGVGPGDEVAVSTFTFAASVNPIRYCGARPVFIDSERTSWNMDPQLLEQWLAERARTRRLPKAVVLVHLYGQCADLAAITRICAQYGVTLIEDAAEALGANYRGRAPGTFGFAGAFSFNGNKIITTGGGGMLVFPDAAAAAHARKLATQARDPAPHYEHSEIGYNYRLSSVLAAIGRGQLRVLSERVEARRRIFQAYETALSDLPGLSFMPEADWGMHSRWLTCVIIDAPTFGLTREQLRAILEEAGIEARPLWKPMDCQPVFAEFDQVTTGVAEELFDGGLCLPSGSNLTDDDVRDVVAVIRNAAVSQPA